MGVTNHCTEPNWRFGSLKYYNLVLQLLYVRQIIEEGISICGFTGIRARGSKPDPPNFFILCLQWGLAAFQWVSNDISTVYLTTIVTRFFDENDIFILLESSIPALQDGYGIFDVRKL